MPVDVRDDRLAMDRRPLVHVSIAAGLVLTLLTGLVRTETLAGGEHTASRLLG